MKLPRYTATTTPPRISGLARTTNITALVRTSDIEKWQAIGTMGQALSFAGRLAFTASQNRRALDDEIEGGIFTQKAQELFNLGDKEATAYDFTNNMPQLGDEDYYTTVENYSTEIRDKATADTIGGTTKKLQKLISSIKSPRVKEKAEIWLSMNIEQKSEAIRHTYAAGHENWQITQMTKMMETAAENGDIETADRLARKMDEFNLITPQRAEILKKNNKIIADTSITTQMAQAIMALKGLQAAKDFVMAQKIDIEIKANVISKLNFVARQQQDQLEIAIQEDENNIFNLISTGQSAEDYINNSRVLDADTKWKWRQREQAESERLAKGEDIVTDNEISSNLYSGIFQVLTGAKTKQEVLEQAKEARLDGSLSQPDYESFEKAINAQYEQAYTYNMGQVNRIAEGLLLNPDSLGYIKNAPIRYKILGNFRKAWLQWISDKGDTIKISEIYPEGMRMAAAHQISDEEAERQEVEMTKGLREKEERKKATGKAAGKAAVEAIKRIKAISELPQPKTLPQLPQPKTKEEYDELKSGTKYIDPEGVERTKK